LDADRVHNSAGHRIVCAGQASITLLIATGLRRLELLGLRWPDYDDAASTITVTGKVIRVTGHGLQRVDETSMTQDRYMARGRIHTQVADLLDRTVSKR
jgi:integrase